MSVLRINKTSDYTVMSNTHFREKNMSLKAKGLLSLMLSLPENWDYSIEGLATLSSDGSTSVRSALKELEKLNYLKRTAVRVNGKIVDWQYDIYEKPYEEKPAAAAPQEEKPAEEKPHVDFPQVENEAQLNTKELNTNSLKTKESNTQIYISVVSYLNEKAGTKYKATTAATKKHINARMEEGFTLEDFKTVIDKKSAEWKNTDMEKYLRPETLFGTKFESYLNAKVTTLKPQAYQRKEDVDLTGIL